MGRVRDWVEQLDRIQPPCYDEEPEFTDNCGRLLSIGDKARIVTKNTIFKTGTEGQIVDLYFSEGFNRIEVRVMYPDGYTFDECVRENDVELI
jgi:hypothetical protein